MFRFDEGPERAVEHDGGEPGPDHHDNLVEGGAVIQVIFDLFAQNPDAIDQFKADMKKAVAGLPNM